MRRKRPLNWWLQRVMDDFYAARLMWDMECEAYSKGYETEAAEFKRLKPMPQLKDFLIAHAYKHLDRAA